MSEIDVDLAHRWQEFRIRCLKLAVELGATDETAIGIADKLGEYILTRSPREIGTAKIESEKTITTDRVALGPHPDQPNHKDNE